MFLSMYLYVCVCVWTKHILQTLPQVTKTETCHSLSEITEYVFLMLEQIVILKIQPCLSNVIEIMNLAEKEKLLLVLKVCGRRVHKRDTKGEDNEA